MPAGELVLVARTAAGVRDATRRDLHGGARTPHLLTSSWRAHRLRDLRPDAVHRVEARDGSWKIIAMSLPRTSRIWEDVAFQQSSLAEHSPSISVRFG